MATTQKMAQPPFHWLTFCYTAAFLREWKALRYTDDHLRGLEEMLCEQPECGDLVQGTGGLRKLRLARPGRGKSGGSRVGYAYFHSRGRILMVAIYAKNDQANFTADQKKAIRATLEAYAAQKDRGEP